MILDENEVIPYQKSPWNALCKNGILLKIPFFFKTKFKDTTFSIKHHSTIIYVPSMKSSAYLFIRVNTIAEYDQAEYDQLLSCKPKVTVT